MITCLWNVLGHVPTRAERLTALERMRALAAQREDVVPRRSEPAQRRGLWLGQGARARGARPAPGPTSGAAIPASTGTLAAERSAVTATCSHRRKSGACCSRPACALLSALPSTMRPVSDRRAPCAASWSSPAWRYRRIAWPRGIPIWDDVFRSRSWGKYPKEELVRFIARRYYGAPDRSAVRILDLGCGYGAATWYLAREGFAVSAIDGSRVIIDLLQRTACIRAALRRSDGRRYRRLCRILPGPSTASSTSRASCATARLRPGKSSTASSTASSREDAFVLGHAHRRLLGRRTGRADRGMHVSRRIRGPICRHRHRALLHRSADPRALSWLSPN